MVGMIVTMLAARLMEKNSFGTYKQMLLITGFLSSIISAGLSTSVSYYYKNMSRDKQKVLITNSLIISLLISLISTMCIVILKDDIAQQFNNQNLSLYMFALAVYFFIITFFVFFDNVFISQGKAQMLSIINIAYTLTFCMVVGGAIYLKQDIFRILFSMAAVEFLRGFVLLALCIASGDVSARADWYSLKKQVIYCIPLGLTYLLQSINVYLDKFMVSSYFTPDIYAVYANGTADIPFVGMFTISVVTTALPTFSYMYNTENNKEGVFKLWGELTKNTAVFLYPIFWVLLFFSQSYILFLYSDKYIASIPIFIVFLMKLPLACTVFGNMLIVMNKKIYIVYNMAIGIIINIMLNLLLIKPFAMLGAVSAALITQILLVILQLFQIHRFSGIKFSQILPYGELGKILLISGIAGACAYMLSRVINIGVVWNLFVYGPLTIILAFAFYFLSGITTINEVLGRVKDHPMKNASKL
jgi:O-antigen/teichoic acid export membrane protein